ncbi:MAG: GspJ family T2SS minor pseudopilin variant LspJ [Legionellaceae bacterium]|nr:GspJ family T2SS minor pseudopilin variant LspJ [Legionellaceae bacterium]
MNKGFTLIEVLIALLVFAILSAITASAMFYAFSTRSRINAYADRLAQLQIAINLINQDTSQIINRPVRGNDMRTFPPFIGTMQYIEFTRTGILNPGASVTRSSLKRVALLCQNDQLIRRSWPQVDNADRMRYEDRILIPNLSQCQFMFLNKNRQRFEEWLSESMSSETVKEMFPSGIQLQLTIKDWGEMSLLYLVPEALYANL